MFSSDPRRQRRNVRPRPGPERARVEELETRQLMAYSALGFSLPQLAVSGYSARQAAWGGSLTVDVRVENIGASSLIEPTNLAPGATSTADAPATTVQVYASTRPNARSGLVLIDTVAIPAVRQNSEFETISTIALPARPAGFPGVGGKVYLTYVVNNNQAILETSTATNIFRVPTPVKIANALPNLQVVALDIPGSLQPGDVISPTIRIENLGTADPALQGPVTVQLVASLNKTFGPGDAVVGSYVISSLPGSSGIPTQGSIANDANVIPPANINTTTLPALKLPTTPGFYYLGIVIDPYHTINQTYAPSAKLRSVVSVGPPERFLPSSNLIATSTGAPTFPALPGSNLTPIATTPVVVVPPLFPNPPQIVPSPIRFGAAKKAKS